MKYEFDTPLDVLDALKDSKCEDCWIGVTREDKKIGADYNYYVDHDGDGSAIYSAFPSYEGEDVLYTSTDDYEVYHIDFDDPEWKKKLKEKMIQFCEERAV